MKAPSRRDTLLKERVVAAVGAELRAIDEMIASQIGTSVGLIREIGGFIAGAGGKRLRPILLLMAARLAGYRGPRAVHMGCVLELLHTATLVHDDVVDHAPLRRGRPSVNARWGDDASVLVGDYLYAKSFALMVQDRDLRVLETLAGATVTTEADYLQIVTQKTASFISACCRIGGLLGESAPEQLDGLSRYGLDIGIAFQISDDSLDFVADQARLGKAVGADLREGKITLPLIAALDRAAGPERDRIQDLLALRAPDPEQVEEIRLAVMKHKGVEYALDRAHVYAQTAKSALQSFPECADRETLALIADFVVDRDF
jgi:octaprenyl-diphosphate synthase